MLTQEQEDFVAADFLAYSGGYEPHEAADEVERYITGGAYPSAISVENIEEFFAHWIDKCEKRDAIEREEMCAGVR